MSSTRELYGIFADNLRLLTQGQRSVSELCRELGVNRTQFNRYLSGQASPRPEVLQRICSHFGVDGRILLEPLHSLHDTRAEQLQPFNAIFDYLYRGRELLALRSPPPEGHTPLLAAFVAEQGLGEQLYRTAVLASGGHDVSRVGRPRARWQPGHSRTPGP